MMNWLLIFCSILAPSLGLLGGTYQDSAQPINPPPNGWKGLVPLRSTRPEVERLLGKPSRSPGSFEIYITETERVDVRYSAGRCEPSPVERWDIAKGVVISMAVVPQRTIPIESLHLDPKRYVRFRESHPENWVQYWNLDEGVIVHSMLEGNEENLYFIEYRPSAKDKSLRCSTNE